MRRSLVALCLLAFMTPTHAQEFDVPTLRGSSPFIPAAPKYTRWAGFYFGAQIGQGSAEMNFAGATSDLVSFLLRNTALEQQQRPSQWATLGKENPSGLSYGAFTGYNVQFSDVIFGVDFHYNRSSFAAAAPVTPIRRVVVAGGNVYDVTVEGNANMRITDYGAARLRAGWIVGNFLPYGTVGLAVGRANVQRAAHVYGVENPATTPFPFDFSATDGKTGGFLYGWAVGGGMDVMIMPNLFLRGEIEYIWFTKLEGIQSQIGTARVGAGWKF